MGEPNLFDDGIPVLPYAGTSGHSGTDTSKERAVSQDKSGRTAVLQKQVMLILSQNRSHGATWKEVADWIHMHHGTVSGALSVLHKTGYISRLKEKRNGCKVYVLPNYVNGRLTELQKNKCCPNCGWNL